MRLRAATQQEVELACAQWGIPGRGEVDAAHRKIAELQRELRRLRERLDATPAKAATPEADADPAAAASASTGSRGKAGTPDKPAKTSRKR